MRGGSRLGGAGWGWAVAWPQAGAWGPSGDLGIASTFGASCFLSKYGCGAPARGAAGCVRRASRLAALRGARLGRRGLARIPRGRNLLVAPAALSPNRGGQDPRERTTLLNLRPKNRRRKGSLVGAAPVKIHLMEAPLDAPGGREGSCHSFRHLFADPQRGT